MAAAVLADLIYGADVRVIQCRSSAGLALESIKRVRISFCLCRQEFKGDPAAQIEVFSFINHTHTAAAELREHAVMRDGLTNHGEGTPSKRFSDVRRGPLAKSNEP